MCQLTHCLAVTLHLPNSSLQLLYCVCCHHLRLTIHVVLIVIQDIVCCNYMSVFTQSFYLCQLFVSEHSTAQIYFGLKKLMVYLLMEKLMHKTNENKKLHYLKTFYFKFCCLNTLTIACLFTPENNKNLKDYLLSIPCHPGYQYPLDTNVIPSHSGYQYPRN